WMLAPLRAALLLALRRFASIARSRTQPPQRVRCPARLRHSLLFALLAAANAANRPRLSAHQLPMHAAAANQLASITPRYLLLTLPCAAVGPPSSCSRLSSHSRMLTIAMTCARQQY
ncbi:hypothetical protein Dimus_037059, partial [Dionaea muscipula]